MGNSRISYLAKNTLLFTISSFGSKLISFFFVPLYTNTLSTADYGTADLITTTVSLLMFVFSINIASGVLRFSIDSEEYHQSYLRFGLRVFIVGFAVMGFSVYPILNRDFFGLNVTHFYYILGIYFFTGLNELLSNYNRARDKVWLIVISGLSTTIVTAGLNVFLLVGLKIGFKGYMLSIIIGQFVACMIQLAFGWPFKGRAHSLSREQKKEIVLYSIPLIFNGIAWWMNQSLDKYFITSMLSVNENGIYAVASKIPTILSTCLTIFMQAWNLSAIKEFYSSDSAIFYSNTYRTLRCFLSLCASILIVLSIPIAKLMFAKEFFVAWQYSAVLLLAGVFSGMSSFLGSIFSAAKKSNIFAYSTIAAAVVNIVLNVLLIPIWGVHGATIATAISFFIIYVIRYICAQRIVRININIISEILIYTLLSIQIILSQTQSHMYIIQLCIFILIAFISKTELLRIIDLISHVCKKQ